MGAGGGSGGCVFGGHVLTSLVRMWLRVHVVGEGRLRSGSGGDIQGTRHVVFRHSCLVVIADGRCATGSVMTPPGITPPIRRKPLEEPGASPVVAGVSSATVKRSVRVIVLCSGVFWWW